MSENQIVVIDKKAVKETKKAENQALKAEKDKLKAEVQAEKDKLKAENQALKAEKDKLKAEQKAFKAEVQAEKDKLKAEKDAFKAEVQAKKDEEQALKAKEQALKAKEQALKAQEQLVKAQEQAKDITKFLEFVSKKENPLIVLLRQKEVVQWLFGDLSFLPTIDKKNKTADEDKLKVLEDEWGRAIMKERRPDLDLDKQWTNRFGEYICDEIFILLGKVVNKPEKKEHYQPDSEVDDAILEAKAQTFYTSGTAGEKILGSPFKYAEIPELYGKPLKIICMGGAEKVCRESYGNLPGPRCSAQKKKFIDFFRENGIEYIGASDILRSLSL